MEVLIILIKQRWNDPGARMYPIGLSPTKEAEVRMPSAATRQYRPWPIKLAEHPRVDDLIIVPDATLAQLQEIRRPMDCLIDDLQRAPTPDELSQATGYSPDKLAQFMAVAMAPAPGSIVH